MFGDIVYFVVSSEVCLHKSHQERKGSLLAAPMRLVVDIKDMPLSSIHASEIKFVLLRIADNESNNPIKRSVMKRLWKNTQLCREAVYCVLYLRGASSRMFRYCSLSKAHFSASFI